jgi:hypothetical protein
VTINLRTSQNTVARYEILLICLDSYVSGFCCSASASWHSRFISIDERGNLHYTADEKGNIIPDFSRVGYYGGDKEIPIVPL